MFAEEVLVGAWLNSSEVNVILAPGLPQYLDKYHPFLTVIKDLGYNLFVPRYMGTFESGGNFSVENSVKTIESTIDLVLTGEGHDLYSGSEISWNPKRVILIGFSYGALIALLQQKDIDKTVLVCPFVSMKYHSPNSSGENVHRTLSFIERAYPNLYRFKSEELIADLESSRLPEKKDRLTVIASANDKSIPGAELALIKEKYNPKWFDKPGGHSISMSIDLLREVASVK